MRRDGTGFGFGGDGTLPGITVSATAPFIPGPILKAGPILKLGLPTAPGQVAPFVRPSAPSPWPFVIGAALTFWLLSRL